MKLKTLGISSIFLLTLTIGLPLQKISARSDKPAKSAKPSPQVQCQERLKALGLAVFQFTVGDNYDHLPAFSNQEKMRRQLKPFVKNEAIYRCPLGHLYQANKSISGKSMVKMDTWTTVMFYEPIPAHDGGRHVLYVSGAVARLTPAQWEQAKRKSGI